MRGKYSPTVNAAYMKDQEWWHRFSREAEAWTEFDPEGYDSYGYDKVGEDRAGNEEHVYYSDDEFGENWRYNQALNDWAFDGTKPVRD